MVVPRFVRAALNNETIEVHGDGTQTRCFGHVLDVVDGLTKLMKTPDAFGQVVNLGNNEEVSIKEPCRSRNRSLTGSTSEIRFVPYEEAYGEGFEDMQRRVPCLDKGPTGSIGYTSQPGASTTSSMMLLKTLERNLPISLITTVQWPDAFSFR